MTRALIGLGLMCKPPRPGFSKTRLAASIGPDAAARLSAAFLRDCAASIRQASRRAGLAPHAFFRPADAGADIAAILGPDWPLAHADAGDLGATMLEVLNTLLERCPAGAIIIGADVPLLTGDVLVAAADVLRATDTAGVVIAPSVDGGYCLLGVRSREAADALCAPMRWSTPAVLEETLRRATAAALAVHLLPAQRDIDAKADLDWLRTHPGLQAGLAPYTQAALAELEETLLR